jgi:DNA invertase Pin-like site-specific DNA recombinase
MSKPARTVAYYRMSTQKQEDSIERQRSQVVPYAQKHSYAIAEEYVDEGIASDDVRRRAAFRRLLDDCARGKVAVILCDDKDRFGRFDSIDQGYYVKPLRDRGVRLITVAQGLLDWNSFGGRVIDAVLSEGRNQEVRALSRRVATECAKLAKQGDWLGGPVPYAYRVTYITVEQEGRPPRVVPDKLVPGDPEQVEAVRLIFRLCADHGWSIGQIVAELNTRRIPSPSGKAQWRRQTVRQILRNRRYVGDAVRGVRSTGKYHRTARGEVTETTDRRCQRNPPESWTVVKDRHEGLVDRNVWERAQRTLARNQKLTTPHPGGGQFLLTGLLVCGHCGGRLAGRTFAGKRYYQCNLASASRQACLGYTIAEERLVKGILGTLQEGLYAPETVVRLERILREQALAMESEGPLKRKDLEAELERLGKFLAAGRERLPLLPANLLPEYVEMLRGKQEEHDRLAVELRTLQRQRPQVEAAELVAEARARMNGLRDLMLSEDPAEVRQFLRSLLAKVELNFTPEPQGKRTRYVFRGGVLTVFCRDGSLTDLAVIVGSGSGKST